MVRYILCSLIFTLLFVSCKEDKSAVDTQSYVKLSGKTMGTYYMITYKQAEDVISQIEIDSLLKNINASMSTYEPHSIISQFNNLGVLSLNPKKEMDKYFIDVFKCAQHFYEISDHTFDPTVMPLVNYWGFGYENRTRIKSVDVKKVDSLMQFVSMDHLVSIETDSTFSIARKKNHTELDFSAIAKGYGVDVLAKYLKEKGVIHFLVDIGGEMIALGVNPKGKPWTVAISKPIEHASTSEIALTVSLKNRALASSGNYRNFYESGGQKYSHTINPKTGFPERSSLLGVSIMAATCMDADAIATTCMVKGLDKSKEWIQNMNDVEACFIYNDADTLAMFLTDGFSQTLN